MGALLTLDISATVAMIKSPNMIRAGVVGLLLNPVRDVGVVGTKSPNIQHATIVNKN
jgi:hypothetical protein